MFHKITNVPAPRASSPCSPGPQHLQKEIFDSGDASGLGLQVQKWESRGRFSQHLRLWKHKTPAGRRIPAPLRAPELRRNSRRAQGSPLHPLLEPPHSSGGRAEPGEGNPAQKTTRGTSRARPWKISVLPNHAQGEQGRLRSSTPNSMWNLCSRCCLVQNPLNFVDDKISPFLL